MGKCLEWLNSLYVATSAKGAVKIVNQLRLASEAARRAGRRRGHTAVHSMGGRAGGDEHHLRGSLAGRAGVAPDKAQHSSWFGPSTSTR